MAAGEKSANNGCEQVREGALSDAYAKNSVVPVRQPDAATTLYLH